MPPSDPIAVTEGSGNVFRDLMLPDPEGRQTVLTLAVVLNRILESRDLDHREVAALLGIDEDAVHRIRALRLRDLSIHDLVRHVAATGHDVDIRITPCGTSEGRITVSESTRSRA